jgi:hypothetical protein
MEDDIPIKPTDISPPCTSAKKSCANYFPDMVYAAKIYFIDFLYYMIYIYCIIDIGSRIFIGNNVLKY